MHAWTQKRGVPEEAKIGRTITRIEFFTCALGAPLTDSRSTRFRQQNGCALTGRIIRD